MAYGIISNPIDPDSLVINSDFLMGDTVTLNAGTYASGALLGRITAGGAYITSLAAAADGSQVVAAVLPQRAAPLVLAAPTQVYVYYTGDFNANLCSVGAGHTIAALRQPCASRGIRLISPSVAGA